MGDWTESGEEDRTASTRLWLSEQQWERDTDGPIISLGENGDFDDTHIFAPVVANTDRKLLLRWLT